MGLTFQGTQITATVDGGTVSTVNDSTFLSGQVGIGVVGYQTDMFDNLTITPGNGTAQPPSGPITSGIAGKCLDDNGGSTVNGTKAQIWDCNGTGAQTWTYNGGALQVNGKCLDITGAGTTANGTLVEIWDCNGGGNQQWQQNGNTLVNPDSGRCLDDPGFSATNGTQVEIWDCNGGVNQQWHLPSA
ncbi:ricin-type beta-trefoil lectin domain protein [Catenulispora yoronensis]